MFFFTFSWGPGGGGKIGLPKSITFWKALGLYFNSLQEKWQTYKKPNIYCKI